MQVLATSSVDHQVLNQVFHTRQCHILQSIYALLPGRSTLEERTRKSVEKLSIITLFSFFDILSGTDAGKKHLFFEYKGEAFHIRFTGRFTLLPTSHPDHLFQ